MTEQEIKDRIRREYPPGTKFYPVDTYRKLNKDKLYTVMKSWRIDAGTDEACFVNSRGEYSHDCYIYHQGKWAGIVQQGPKPGLITKLIPVTKYVEGLRVQRGPDWRYSDQDGGAGKLGTVTALSHREGWVKVKWDTGKVEAYRIGDEGKYDLALADPADAHLLEDKSEFHNPDNLTPEQVGEGYRLLYISEHESRRDWTKSIHKWSSHSKIWDDTRWTGNDPKKTYRVPACFPKDFTKKYVKDYEAGLQTKPTPVEDLLKEAKRRYPVGTKYKCPGELSDIFTVTKQSFSIPKGSYGDIIHAEDGKGILYNNGKWAEIISVPEVSKEPTEEEMIAKLTEMYPVGTVFKPATSSDHMHDSVTVKKDWEVHKIIGGYEFVNSRSGFRVHAGYLYATNNGVYAEIISQPKVEDTSDILKAGDTVVFKGPKGDREYHVAYTCLGYQGKRKGGNSIIFQDLGIDPKVLAKECYGYPASSGEWPSSKYKDHEALTRLVNKLHELCAEATAIPPSKYQVGDVVKVCKIGADTDKGYCNIIHDDYYPVSGFAEKSGTIKYKQFRPDVNEWYYNLSIHEHYSYIAEHALSYLKDTIHTAAIEKEYTAEELGKQSSEVIKAYLERKYPVGTTFIPVAPSGIYDNKFTVKEGDWITDGGSRNRAWFKDKSHHNCHPGYLYHEDCGLAEIVSLPTVVEEPAETYHGFVVGKVYMYQNDCLAYFCGLSDDGGGPVFELIDYKACAIKPPENWISKGNNTYWRYWGLEKMFDPIPVEEKVSHTTNTHNTVQATPSGVFLENPTILISTQNEKVTSRGSVSFEQHSSSREGIFLPRADFEIRKGTPVRGSRLESSAVEITIGNRHRDN